MHLAAICPPQPLGVGTSPCLRQSAWSGEGLPSRGLYEHCLAEFRRALTLETAVQQLVWAHAHAPEGARAVAMEFVVANCGAIQVVVAFMYLEVGSLFILALSSGMAR